ncbi:uncharacterized protein N7459_000623 [Penicillium hispanicum]|uniref:uncharacterized protein n=1 Tax=Penicillium hispanicum TaxID=1080232 RepID=UPI00253FA186|nr:uncharacterized protein N7459_000623 [Penicillium hispanicum]KAJ5594415.1 hypothetical protein N7459_000623 [Penicillium hispanicum]
MSWLFGSSSGKSQCPEFVSTAGLATTYAMCKEKNTPAPPSQTQAQPAQTEKPKPCCVCKDEKTARDDCMLFSKSEDPAKECKSTIEQYKTCMAGFGFKI